MRDRSVIPANSGRSRALGSKDPRHYRDATAQVPENVPGSEAIQRLQEPPAGATEAQLREYIVALIRALKARG